MGSYDWGAPSLPEVEAAIIQTANRVAARYKLETDDLAQEGRVRTANREVNLAQCIDDGEFALYVYRLEQDLNDIAKVIVAKRDRNTSYEERYDTSGDVDSGDIAPRPATMAIRREVTGYTRELVESLIPAVWDESFCYSIRVENAPDADMPRRSTNKATGNTVAAHIADIKTGWRKTPLSTEQRQRVFLRYAVDWSRKEIAYNQGVTAEAIRKSIPVALERIAATLNGPRLATVTTLSVRQSDNVDRMAA